MQSPRRHIRHSGPVDEDRVAVVAGRGHSFTCRLQPGLTLHDAVTRALAERDIASAALTFQDAVFEPLVYYLPLVVESGPPPRFSYSPPHTATGDGRVAIGNVTHGWRDGEPFVHCHAAWQEADREWRAGHVVPTESVLAEPVDVTGWTVPGARMLSDHDAETGYTLFRPVVTDAPAIPGDGHGMAVARVKPNEDLCEAVEAICLREGYAEATIRGSLGSLIGARFSDGRSLDDIASEVLVTAGRVQRDAEGRPRAEIDIVFSGFSGLAHRGRLLRGENPVCITFEMLIEERPGTRTAGSAEEMP